VLYIKKKLCLGFNSFNSDASLNGASGTLSGRSAQRGVLSDDIAGSSDLLDGHSFIVALEGIVASVFLKLNGSVLIKELVDRQVPTTDSNVDLVFVYTYGDTLGTELVHTVALTHEHNLQLLSVREVVDVLSETLVNGITLDWNVDSNARLEVDDVLLQGLDLHHGGFQIELTFFEGFKDVETRLLTDEVLVFKLLDVASSSFELSLYSILLLEHLVELLAQVLNLNS